MLTICIIVKELWKDWVYCCFMAFSINKVKILASNNNKQYNKLINITNIHKIAKVRDEPFLGAGDIAK